MPKVGGGGTPLRPEHWQRLHRSWIGQRSASLRYRHQRSFDNSTAPSAGEPSLIYDHLPFNVATSRSLAAVSGRCLRHRPRVGRRVTFPISNDPTRHESCRSQAKPSNSLDMQWRTLRNARRWARCQLTAGVLDGRCFVAIDGVEQAETIWNSVARERSGAGRLRAAVGIQRRGSSLRSTQGFSSSIASKSGETSTWVSRRSPRWCGVGERDRRA